MTTSNLDLRHLNAGDVTNYLFQLANSNRKTTAAIVIVILLAFLLGAAADAGMRGLAKEKQIAQEKQFQAAMKQAQQKRAEDAQRQKIAVDAARKAELENELNQFSSTLNYDMSKLNATGAEYGSGALTDYNFAKRVEITKRLVLIINEYKSHLDGFEQFVHENLAELKRLGITKPETSEADALQGSTKAKAFLKSMLTEGLAEFEKFVGHNAARLKTAGEVIQLIKDSLASFEQDAGAAATGTGSA